MALTPARRSAAGPTLYAFSRVWAQLAGGILFLVTSVRISPGEFGEFAIATSIFGALMVCVGQGTYEYVIKARDSATAPATVFLINMTTATLAALATYVITLVIPHIVEGKSISKMLTLLIPAFYLLGMNGLLEAVIMKHGEITKVAVASIVTETVALVVALVALFNGAGVLALVFQRITREVTLMLTYVLTSKWSPQFNWRLDEAWKVIAFAKDIVATRFIGMGTTAAVDVMIGAVLSTADAGLYRLAMRMLTMGSDVLFQPLRAMMWVSLPPLQDNAREFSRTALRLLEVFGVGYFAIMVGAALVAGPVFVLAFDPEWSRAIVVVYILVLARLLIMPSFLAETVFALKSRTRSLTRAAVINATLTTAAALVVAPHGLVPYCIASVVVMILNQVYVVPILAQSGQISPVAQAKLFAKLSLNALVMIAVVAPLLAWGPGIGVTDWTLVACAVFVGAAAYILAARKFTPDGYAAYEDAILSAVSRGRRLLLRGPA